MKQTWLNRFISWSDVSESGMISSYCTGDGGGLGVLISCVSWHTHRDIQRTIHNTIHVMNGRCMIRHSKTIHDSATAVRVYGNAKMGLTSHHWHHRPYLAALTLTLSTTQPQSYPPWPSLTCSRPVQAANYGRWCQRWLLSNRANICCSEWAVVASNKWQRIQ